MVIGYSSWLMVWNHGILTDFPIYWECHHPNWSELHDFSVAKNHQVRFLDHHRLLAPQGIGNLYGLSGETDPISQLTLRESWQLDAIGNPLEMGVSIGKSSINSVFSIAMFDYGRVWGFMT